MWLGRNVIVYKKADEWYIEWQRMTTNDNEWQHMKIGGSEWQWYNEWKQRSTIQRMGDAILSVTKTDFQQTKTDFQGWMAAIRVVE